MPYLRVPRFCGIYYAPTVVVVDHAPVNPIWLPQVSLSTNSTLYDTASRTVLTQTFVNPSKTEAIESAKYNFPLYESCAVVAFRCFVGERLIEGIVKEKNEAKAEYKEAVKRGETAGLLEQQSPDVFTTSIGNIPAGETIKVEVEYIMELKHDAEIDGLRFTIPTSIAPRYGDAPSGLDVYADGKPISGAVEKGGMKISVQVTMPSNIRSLSSPSHQLEVHLGGHAPDVPDDAFNPKQALATLSQTSAELGADFVLLVKCADLSLPRALVETHPTIPNSKALMVTLVPKFTLPTGPLPEIVFVVDRSGSMEERVESVKSALTVFLKSLPVGVKFNICSFGSDFSFLWNKSQAYSAETLEQAQRHVDSMDADMGGTEILAPIVATVSARYKDLPLEIMVLTDGEVWNTEELFDYVGKQTLSGDVRLFSFGIGEDVSHALVEGLARVGRGFAQIVSNEKEGIEGKVVRMLRGGLSVHIKDFRLEWEGRPSEKEIAASANAKLSSVTKSDTVKQKINLFDTQANTDPPIKSGTGVGRYAHLPEFVVPTIIQAPYKLPPLFPFSRSTAYALISGDTPVPSSVWLRGTTPSGDELELEIAVQTITEKAQTVHQLAARKVLQELEEGIGYLHSGNYGVNKEDNEGTFDEWVGREGTRVGVTYGVASKWTSFLAVEGNENELRKFEKELDDSETMVFDGSDNDEDEDDWAPISGKRSSHSSSESSLVMSRRRVCEVDEVADEVAPAPLQWELPEPLLMAKSQLDGGPQLYGETEELSLSLGLPSREMATRQYASVSHGPVAVDFGSEGGAEDCKKAASSQPTTRDQTIALQKSGGETEELTALSVSLGLTSREMVTPQYARVSHGPVAVGFGSEGGTSNREKAAPSQPTTRDRTKALIALQTFDGSFPLNNALATILGVPLTDLEAKLSGVRFALNGEVERKKVWATVLAVWMFENKWTTEVDVWELVVEKAKRWMGSVAQNADIVSLQNLAASVL